MVFYVNHFVRNFVIIFVDKIVKTYYTIVMKTTNESFRKAVAKWLDDTNTPHENLAIMVGRSPSSLYKYLRGETTHIPMELAIDIAAIVGFKFEVE